MENEIYTLKEILDTLSKYKNQTVKKRLIFDQSAIGGIGSKWLISFFILIPFLEYAAIFNPYVFDMLGIAQAIIFFIVFLSMVILLIFTIATLNNAKAVKKITPSWNHYFPNIDLKLIVTSSASPYKETFKYYGIALNNGLNSKKLYQSMKQAFVVMQEENKDLLEAMRNDRAKENQ